MHIHYMYTCIYTYMYLLKYDAGEECCDLGRLKLAKHIHEEQFSEQHLVRVNLTRHTAFQLHHIVTTQEH